MSNIKGFIFDLDGVLVNTAEFHYRAWQRLADEEGLPFNRDDNEALRGISRRESLDIILKGRVIPEEKIQEMLERKNNYYLDLVQTLTPGEMLPGAINFLVELHTAGIHCALGSASKNANEVVERLGIAQYFDAIVDGNSVKTPKPAPDLFQEAAARIKLLPSQCVVVEDAAAGIRAARAGGFFSIGLGPKERVIGADLILPSLDGATLDEILVRLSPRMNHPPSPWYENAVFYEVYVRAYFDSNADGHGDLVGLAKKLPYLKDLGVDCIWLLPVYASPLKDDGYDISDYYSIHPDFGKLGDFKFLLEEAHRQGLRVLTDLVLNHTSDAHPWFQAARSDRNSPYRDYYVWSDDDKKYSGARIIFLDSQSSNWTWDPVAGQYFWHRFFPSQPDLNFDNPTVQEELLKVVDFWLALGIDGFRVDAVPYLFEREGTNCENLPETHAYLKRFRKFVEDKYPGRLLLCEANQLPRDVRVYFGDGDEFQMGFNFPMMPKIFMALKQGKRDPIIQALGQIPPIPEGCQWANFLRNHDELTLEMVTPEERDWMWEHYAPEKRMRLNLGIRRRLAPLLDNDRRKIELAYSLILSLPGVPFLYYGDEIGMGDDINLPDRNGVRTPMQWDATPQAGFSTSAKPYVPVIHSPDYSPTNVNAASQQADPHSLWHAVRRLISLRKEQAAFNGKDITVIDSGNEAVLAFERKDGPERIIVLANLSGIKQKVERKVVPLDDSVPVDLVTGRKTPSGVLSLEPFEFIWLKN